MVLPVICLWPFRLASRRLGTSRRSTFESERRGSAMALTYAPCLLDVASPRQRARRLCGSSSQRDSARTTAGHVTRSPHAFLHTVNGCCAFGTGSSSAS